MDLLTQSMLGAAVTRTLAPKLSARFSYPAGALAGILPDLDYIIYPAFPHAIDRFDLHRSFSHSLVLAPLLAVVLAGLLLLANRKLHVKSARPEPLLPYWRWYLITLTVLVTHILLDLCTSYHTQIFWPLSRQPYALSAVFVIDLFYTIPLGCALYFCYDDSRNQRQRPFTWLHKTLLATSAYLLLAICVKLWSYDALKTTVMEQPPIAGSLQGLDAINTPTNILYWRWLYATDHGIATAIVPIWGFHAQVHWHLHLSPENVQDARQQLTDHKEFIRLQQLSNGLYFLDRVGMRWRYSDIRFGAPELGYPYLFAFEIGTEQTDRPFHSLQRFVWWEPAQSDTQ
ncbi:MAG: metal-dependent hydrolase [Gammaproteobacteria bacterium]